MNEMTVRQLIIELLDWDQDATVMVPDIRTGAGLSPVVAVEKSTEDCCGRTQFVALMFETDEDTVYAWEKDPFYA